MTWNPGLSRVHFYRGGRSREGGAIFLGAVLTSLNPALSLTIARPRRTPTSRASEACRAIAEPQRFPFSPGACFVRCVTSLQRTHPSRGSRRADHRDSLPGSVSEAESSKGRAPARDALIKTSTIEYNISSAPWDLHNATALALPVILSKSGGREFIPARVNVPPNAWSASVILATRRS